MWRKGVPVCIIYILQLYTSPNMSTPGESIPGPHICMSVSMPHAHSAREGRVQLSVVAYIRCEVVVTDAVLVRVGVSCVSYFEVAA